MKRVLRTPLISLFGLVLTMCFGLINSAMAAPGDILFSDDFERNNLNPGWSRSSSQRAGISTQTANSGTRSLYTCCGAVDVTSRTINLSAVPAAQLSMWIRIGDDINANFSEWPDSPGEDLVIQYFDSASGWVALETFVGGAHTAGAIYNRSYTLPSTAMHANFQIRISQTGGSGNNFDYYHVDDVVLTEITPPPPFGFGSCDDFESGLTNWTVTPISGVAAIAAGVNTVNSPTHALYLANGRVYVTSATIDTSTATSPYLSLWVRRGQDNLDGFSEYPEAGEDLQIQYLDSGNNWVLLDTLPGGGLAGEILNLSYPLPANAIHANFKVRLYQTNGSGVGWDYWHVDDVCVTTPSTTALVAYYAEDEPSWNGTNGEVLDSSVNVLNGTGLNGVTTAPAKVCRGGSFDGLNGPVEIADNALLDISNNFSASAWIQPNSLPGSGLMTILSKDTNYEFHINPAGEIYWWWNDSTGTARTLTTSGANITPGNWYHVAVTYASGQQRIYVNGVQLASSSRTGNLITNNNPLQIGGDQGFAGRQFNGLIDEVRVYAAEQSQAEVIVDMNATHACPTTPVALYHLDEPSWGVVTDSSGNGNDGSTSGTVTSASTIPAITGNPGTCSYASIPNNTTLSPSDAINSALDVDAQIGDRGTISFWYNSNAPWINGGDRQLFDATNPATGEFFDLVLQSNQPGRGRLRFELVDNAGNRERVRTGDLNIAAGTWTHIAVTWDLPADVMEIYINGVLDSSNNTNTSGVLGNMTTLFIGDNRSTVLGRRGTANSANGLIDEIRVYDLVQTVAQVQADMNATHPCTANQVHHYRILHDGSALTCNPETVTVQACLDAGCTSFYSGNVSATLDPSATPVSITNGSGIAAVAIRNNTASAITLALSGATPAATNTTECFNTTDSSASCVLTFYDSGFVFDVPNLTSCSAATNITVSAVRKDLTTQSCVPAFSNRTATLKFWSDYVNPAAGANTVNVNGTNVSTTTPGTNISLNFNASGQSTINVSYPDAGQVQLNARFDGAAGTEEQGLIMTGNDTFVAVPAKFIVASGDANAGCATGDATCSAFTQAGAAFNLSVSAACADNSVTPNFIANGITLGHNLVAPLGGSAGTLGTGSINIVDADNGIATIGNQSIDEVGVFSISAVIDNYLGVTATPGNHLIEGLSNNIGRFYPADFNVTHNHNPACTAGINPFTYAGLNGSKGGQPFDVTGAITARNTSGNTTLNYVGAFAKLQSADLSAVPLRLLPSAVGALGSWNVDPLNFNSGTTNFTAQGSYSFDSTPPIALGPQNVYLRVIADDGDANGNEEDNTKTVNYRFGQLRMSDAFGPQSSDLDMSIIAQYHNGVDFVENTDDSCTALPGVAGVTLSNWQANLQNGETSVSAISAMLLSGSGTITLAAPGTGADGNDGSVDVSPAAAAVPWLQVDSNGDGNYAEDPLATAIFGIYRGDDRFLFWHE